MKRFCVLFAGPVGSGKSHLASYLSYKLFLPVFCNDLIRVEVMEDLLRFDQKEYEKRKIHRLKEVVKSGNSFILDGSIDRQWNEYKKMLMKAQYQTFIISLDYSMRKLVELYKVKQMTNFTQLEKTFTDHQKFIVDYGYDINISLDDRQFTDRLEIVYKAVKKLV